MSGSLFVLHRAEQRKVAIVSAKNVNQAFLFLAQRVDSEADAEELHGIVDHLKSSWSVLSEKDASFAGVHITVTYELDDGYEL